MDLSEIAGCGATMKFINGLLGEVLPPGDVDGLEPSFLAPAPGGALRHANLFQPFGKADNRSSDGR